MTIREVLLKGASQLQAEPRLSSSARQDAELLLFHTLNLPRTALYAEPDRPLSSAEEATYAAAIARRLHMEPVQYITGVQEFFGLPFQVSPAVLIPRPETEGLVEAALTHLSANQPLRLADVGTGSGAIAIALASRLPLAKIVALDVSEAALDVARANARQNSVESQVEFIQSDLFNALTPATPLFDAILSNPPYVAEADRAGLHPEVSHWEPASALFAGADGLEIYRRLIPDARRWLRPGGLLALEIGSGQRDQLAALLTCWDAVAFLPDLQGIARVALARKP